MTLALRSHKKKIGKHEYTIVSVPGWDAFEIQQQLVSLFGAGVGTLLALGALTKKDDETSKMIAVPSALEQVAKGIGAPEFRKIAERLLAGGLVDNKPLDQHGDAHFAENAAEMWQVIWFAIERNFGSFFDIGPVAGLFRRTKAEVQKLSTDPMESTPGLPTSSAGTPS